MTKQPHATPRVPRQIGDYQLVEVLGRGGMGVVYRATHATTGAAAAVKTVLRATESTLESIRREIHMLQALAHRGVVAIRDHGVADGVPWYAMDLLDGRTLRDDIRAWFPDQTPADGITRDLLKPARAQGRPVNDAAPPYSIPHVVQLFRKLCEPLAYVHGQGVIHHDLTPSNIFVIGDDEPVLFDFGLSSQFRVDTARDVLEIGGLTRGTPHYMAPEQARGEIVDARADVYALGCILFEALTGAPPFTGKSSMGIMMQHLEHAARPPSAFVGGIPRALDELVLRMLEKVPRDRIGYVEDVASALEKLGAPPPRRRASTPPPRAYTYRPGIAGRDTLLAELERLLVGFADGPGGFAYLIGESGVGKTRLAAELASRAYEHDIRAMSGECEPHGGALHPLRPLLRTVADRCKEAGAYETARLLRDSAGLLATYEPALGAFAPADDERARSPLTASASRFRVLAEMRDLLAALTAGEKLLLVLDDLQWADDLTLALLRSLGDRHRGLFVLGTVRAEEMTPELAAMLQGCGATRFEVPRLDRDAVGSMIRDMLALDDEAPTLTDFVAKQSEGNPLFAAEYVRIAVDEGVLHRDDEGRWRLTPREDDSYDRLPTPGSVQALVRRRLRSLTEDARTVAAAVAVLGRAYDPSVLASVAALDDDRARDAVAELIQRQVVEAQEDGALRCAHDKLRELAYAELDEARRIELHRRAALAIEARYLHDDELAFFLGELAHHWEQAGDLVRAADYLERAAEHALAGAAFGEARDALVHVLALAVDAAPARIARWERRLGEACYALGDLAACATHTARSLERLGRPLPSTKLARTAIVAGGIGRQLLSRTIGRRRPGQPDSDLVEAALASARMTSCYFFNDDSLGLVGAALAAVNLAERAGAGVPVAEIYAQLGYVAGLARMEGVARSYFAQARATAAATHDPIGLTKALCTEAAYAIGIGGWRDASERAAEALDIARRQRNPQEAEVARTILGHVEFATGRYAASRALAIELRDSARARANVQHEAWGIYTEARADLYVGDLRAAIDRFDQAMAMLEGQSDHASQILCGGMLASALARAGDVERARAAADATIARIGNRTPAVFTIAEGFVGTADAYLELWRRTGDATLADPARVALANLDRLAKVFPIAAGAASIAHGAYHVRRGERRRATRALHRGLATATRLAMPYDQAMAHRALAELEGGEHADRAAAMFRDLGCAWPA